MELFKTLATLLACSTTMTIVVRQNKDGKMTVCTNFTDTNGATDTLQPFMLKGSPKELDNGFIQAITEPAQTVNTLVSNIDAFKKAAAEAEKKAKETKAKPATSSTTGIPDYEKMRKKREEEAKLKKENLTATMAQIKKAILKLRYNEAKALIDYANTLSPDKKEKAELEKNLAFVNQNIVSFMCADDEASGKTGAEEFRKTLKSIEPEEQKNETVNEQPTDTENAETAGESECDENNEPEEDDDDDNNEEAN